MSETSNAKLVSQPGSLPTRKVMIGAVAGVIAAGLQSLVGSLIESHVAFAWLNDPEVRSAIPLLAGFAAAWLFRDRSTAVPFIKNQGVKP